MNYDVFYGLQDLSYFGHLRSIALDDDLDNTRYAI